MLLYFKAVQQHHIFQKARDERGFTNAEIAVHCRVSESYICKIMRGQRPVTKTIREKFYHFLGLPEPQEAAQRSA